MNENKMRKAFEAWARSTERTESQLRRMNSGEYEVTATHWEWMAWQAATRAAVPEGWKVVPLEPTPEMLAVAAVASTELLIHGGPPKPGHRDPVTIEISSAAASYKAALSVAPEVKP